MPLTVATQTQADRLRADTGCNTTSLPDATVDAVWTEAGETYSAAGPLAAFARVIVFRRILAGVLPVNDYVQNQTEEKAGAMFGKAEKALAYWEKQTEIAASLASSGAARFGQVSQTPARIKEYPNQ